jgi:fructose-bisphosphate aldolase class II
MVEQTATLDLDLLARIRRRVGVPLVLHGSSGVPDDLIRAAVATGITKVNVSTQLNRVMTDRIRQLLLTDPKLVDPRVYLGAARDAMTERIAHLLDVISTPPAVLVGADTEDNA